MTVALIVQTWQRKERDERRRESEAK